MSTDYHRRHQSAVEERAVHWPRWIQIVAGIPAVVIAAYLMFSTPKSVKQWLWGMAFFAYFLLYYWVFFK
jgi:hypothetical protein